ncbi:MAG TPA: methyltransferase [Candidatus Borkfalkia avicola]|uniref:Methyltransferase n=1 Tax=Candidatus Borkfalkia avicola TaxID=2838503 RepID=A0A9D2IHY5_9FIRM|nr:methyltransferase [Candidatus Borkfalkia avicola]
MEENCLRPGESLEELFEGGLKIIQNKNYYRFTSDSVLLTRFVRAKRGERVADFCAGSGIVGLHFYALAPEAVSSVTLFEMQPELSEMSARSVALNGLENFTAVCSRVQDIGREYNEAFSLVLCNPPYERGGFENADYKKAVCRKEITVTLADIVDAARRALKFGGRLALVNRADRLAEVLYAMKSRGIEPKRLQFVCGREGAKPYLLLAEGTKGAKEGMEILPALVNARGDHF